MQSAMGSDPVKIMIKNIKTLANMNDESISVEMKLESLENLSDFCEDIDFASGLSKFKIRTKYNLICYILKLVLCLDFHKIGGFALFESLFRSESSAIRAATCHLIATIVQNNPYCQKIALQDNIMTSLLSILSQDPSEQVRVKALYAISCLVREDEAAQEAFLKADGLSHVMRVLQSDVTLDKLHVKAAFLVSNLAKSSDKIAGKFCDSNQIDEIMFIHNLN